MGLRYRKSIKVLPGVKLNISKSGISTSVGKPGSTLNLSKRGVRTTVGIPGTGLSYSRTIGKRRTGRRRSITRQEARTIRLEMKQKYGLNDREIDRLQKLSRKNPGKVRGMSQQELIDYAKGRRRSSGNPSGSSRSSKAGLVIILIILVICFLASLSRR